MPRRIAALVATLALTVASASRANGRFPAAQYVLVGPGPSDSVIVLRSTFGLAVSRDSGVSFHWICEDPLQYSGAWDSPVAITADGALDVGIPTGVIRTPDGCVFARADSAGTGIVQDLANDPLGETVLAVEASPASANRLLVSSDRGVTFMAVAAGPVGVAWQTVEAAPSRAARVYLSGTIESTQTPVLYRSDMGGAGLAMVPTTFAGGVDAFVSGVDSTLPDRVWVRSNLDTGGTVLLRSDNGGMSFAVVAQTTDKMLGFALADDGLRVWYGSELQGLMRSDDAGRTFAQVSSVRVNCLRYHHGALYICGNWLRDGFALARWLDGANALVPILRLTAIDGAVTCAPGTSEHDVCGANWPGQLQMLSSRADAGMRDAATPVDAAADVSVAMDSGVTDVRDSAMDAAGATELGTPVGACGCAVPGRAGNRGCELVLVVLMTVPCAQGTRRSRRRHL